MEAEILRFILSNHGAVNTDELLYNMGYDDTSSIISNKDKFVMCCRAGQPKVVARTKMRLCREKNCMKSCRDLHLCKNFLFSGSCNYTQNRRTCIFCHDLNIPRNEEILKEHGLETLSRPQLCTLMLQSDHTLLPSICHDYNNDQGPFGRCKDGNECKRLHICERYILGDCCCDKNHDFRASQPLRRLQMNGIPDTLIGSLKTVYENKEALWFSKKMDDRSKSSNQNLQQLRALSVSASSLERDLNFQQSECIRGRGIKRGNRGSRGNVGHRGNRGYRGGRGRGNTRGGADPSNMVKARSVSDISDSIGGLDLYTETGLGDDNCGSSEASASASNDDSGSKKSPMYPNETQAATRGRRRDDNNPSHDGGAGRRPKPVREKTEICLFFIKGYCKHDDDKCFKVHDKMPYRWELSEGDQWKALPDNEGIEKEYCDPQNQYSNTDQRVHFDTMTCGDSKVRRLSTSNSLVEPTFMFTTEWLWYWEDETAMWNLYASSGNGSVSVDSSELERKFLINDKDVVEFTAGSQSYSLSFQDMMQTNKHYGTRRRVRRRPQFVSAADVVTRKVRKPQGNLNFCPIPKHWDKGEIPATGGKRVSLQYPSDEFEEIETMFCKTMRGFDIISIERIQNKSLWELFQLQKNQMKVKNGGRNVRERMLFHGTDSHSVDAICHGNFDWRLCGTNGTVYGKGSYFARDAKYSHKYTSKYSSVRSMFVARVLIGEFTKGSPDLVRPPSKDGGEINFYDSCVDELENPSIYVVFDRPQVYPEYLLQYRESGSFYGGDTTLAASAIQPTVTTSQSSKYYSANPSKSTYQPRTTSASTTASHNISQPPVLFVSSQSTPAHQQFRSSTDYSRPSQSATPTDRSASKNNDSCVIA